MALGDFIECLFTFLVHLSTLRDKMGTRLLYARWQGDETSGYLGYRAVDSKHCCRSIRIPISGE
jgi:hypothetical protein